MKKKNFTIHSKTIKIVKGNSQHFHLQYIRTCRACIPKITPDGHKVIINIHYKYGMIVFH